MPYTPNLNPQQLFQMLLMQQQMQQMQPQQAQQGQMPQKPGLASAIKPGTLGNAANQIGRLFGQDWSTIAGDMGGGTEIGGELSTNLPTSLEGLFGGEGAAQTAMAPTQGIGSLGTLPAMGMGAGILGATALAGKGVKDLMSGKDTKGWEGWGGRASLGLATGGLSEVARAFGFGKPARDYRKESLDRVQSLKDKGIQTHNFGDMSGWGVKSKDKDSLSIKDSIKAGLKAEDIWGLPAMYEKHGNDWLKFTEEERRAKAQEVIDSGALIDKDNQLDIDWSKIKAPQVTKPGSGRMEEIGQFLAQNLQRK